MAARRPHPKSRSGCAECKRRRIKCDEGRPDCENCRKRSLRCSFQTFDPVPKSGAILSSSSKNVSSHIHTFPQQPENSPQAAPEQGLLDTYVQQKLLDQFLEPDRPRFLNVLRHFAIETIPTLDFGVAAQAAWRETLPKLATSNKFVTHGILAIGSLHLARVIEGKTEKRALEHIAATQMNLGMTQYRTEVQNVTTDNAEALFAFSTMLTTFVLPTAGFDCETTLRLIKSEDTSADTRATSIQTLLHDVCRIIRSIRGVLVIIVPCWDHIHSGALRPTIDRDWWPSPVPITPEEIEDDKKLHKLQTMWSHPGRKYEYSFDTLRHALKYLRDGFALVSRLICLAPNNENVHGASFDWASVLHWPVQLSLEFITLLEQRNMEAWVLVAHWAMLPAKVNGNIWLDGLASSLISTTALVIGEDNWEWIEWPATAVGVDLNSLRKPTNVPSQPQEPEARKERPTEPSPTDSSILSDRRM